MLRYHDFRLIWSAEALSQTGTQIQRVAVAWQTQKDPTMLGILLHELKSQDIHVEPFGALHILHP